MTVIIRTSTTITKKSECGYFGGPARVFLETKTQPTWGLIPDEPDDVDLLEDARSWSRIYGELVHSMSVVAADRGSPELLDRLAEAERRWAWWRHRVAQLTIRTEEPARTSRT